MHITLGHPEISGYLFDVLETIENPEIICYGNHSELIAVKAVENETNKYLAVVYKELADQTGFLIDGFIITAYSTSKINSFQKRQIAWQVKH